MVLVMPRVLIVQHLMHTSQHALPVDSTHQSIVILLHLFNVLYMLDLDFTSTALPHAGHFSLSVLVHVQTGHSTVHTCQPKDSIQMVLSNIQFDMPVVACSRTTSLSSSSSCLHPPSSSQPPKNALLTPCHQIIPPLSRSITNTVLGREHEK